MLFRIIMWMNNVSPHSLRLKLGDQNPFDLTKVMIAPPIILYRLGHKLHVIGLIRLASGVSWLNRFLFSVWLPSSAKIGKNFKIGYWGLGVVIHSNTVIGDNCQVNQNVTIGRNFGDIKVPEIGHNVYVGAGSVLFGEIKIGDNVIIGSGSLINKDIPNNCTVVGNPFKIISFDNEYCYRDLDSR